MVEQKCKNNITGSSSWMEVWLRLDPQWRPKEEVFTNGTEGNLLADGTAMMMIVSDLRIEGCGSRLNLKDGDDLGQID